ncbi:GreA/GreB family elongation factor [Sandaracinus amylolyticus]|uniref:Transcription elongation factor GreB n=1 Tax=Sandaracinus amylolyticus TaxID=927083 RepID=A0A0F6W8J1_9BACT|nr:GreA/GreB family elongation factor [Sandaracinus amylolyticus]AKF10130.1 Transcription elongation factor GreB [Sandaracinus amylolyticus]
MSKAFLPEDTAVDAGPVLPPRPATPLPITPEGHRRLVEERAALTPGDEATKTRALVLDRILASVDVVPPALLDGGAGFGCAIDVRDERGARRTYVLVGPDEVDPAAGRITAESPIGRRLLRAKAGDVIENERGGKSEELEVIAVRVGA